MDRAEEFYQGMGITVVAGSRYTDGFISDQEAETSSLDEKVQGWADLVRPLSWVVRKHLQSTYAGLQNSLQQEWGFVQRVTSNIGDAF